MIYVPPRVATSQPRRGAVLLVVMAMLALFAAVGLSFVYYADSESTASRYFRQSVGPTRPEVAPELLLGYFLNQLIFDTDNKLSAMRGSGLGRTLFGYKTGGPNNVPFNGAGRLSYQEPAFGLEDSLYMINYTQYEGAKVRDPEIYAGKYIGCNAGWTYPDLHNLGLAAVNADGEVLIQSFHRPWAMGMIKNVAYQKYATLRPHKSYHPLFPDPEDAGGDVKNLEFARGVRNGLGGYFNNDSFWMDLGFGVLTDPATGKKYKPLFASLVIDLDGRVNLNAAGSFKGSNHGLGPWEINISQVMGADWVNIFNGFGGVAGRYGANNLPAGGGAFAALGAGAGQTYSSTDMDGMGGVGYKLPGGGAPALSLYPQFDPGTYGNGGAGEQNNHPGLYNTLVKTADDRVIEARHMELLLRYGGTGAHALTSDLTRLCKDSFLTGGSADKFRRLVTTHSCDLGRPGIAPWLYPGSSAYSLAGAYPAGGASPLPVPTAWPANQGEYDGNGRGYILPPELPNLPGPRLNINRSLPDYPPPAGNNVISDMAGFGAAQDARQKLAKDIFSCLRLVCTGARASDALPAKGSPDYQALRWLAQLSVNIVDYRDRDDYATPFNWDFSDPSDPNNWVFGVEPARVVINEVYSELTNDPDDPGPMDKMILKATKDFKCKFWVELGNPTQGVRRLHNPAAGFPVYKVQIATVQAKKFTESQPGVPDPLGTPEPLNTKLEVADYVPEDAPAPQPLGTVDVNLIRPDSNGDYSGTPGDNELFYVLGPKYDFPGANQATLRVKEQNIGGIQSAMCYDMDFKNTDLTKLPQHNVFLRRLACPHLAPQVAPGPNYNPYVTVDYATDIVTYDGVEYDKDGMNKGVVPADNRVAKGRRQPHDANLDNQAAVGGEPDHTLFKQNSNNKSPFDWLTHLDRALMSPIEILQVSGVQPFELTHRFVVGGNPHRHRAMDPATGQSAWTDSNARIYRLLEFLDCNWRANGVSPDGRIPGKININTIWDKEVFRALCDKNGVSSYSDNVDDIFTKLIASRNPGGLPSVNDRPFRGLSVGNTGLAASGQGVGDTLLRPGVFDVVPANGLNHPYQKKELLSKIFNNVTTRSNVFAVWVTVGFFEVVQDATAAEPVPKLGAEIGRAQGRHVRHRMFAIIDRTKLESSPGVPGNPGPLPWGPPWPSPIKDRFNPREHPGLVPYFTVIE